VAETVRRRRGSTLQFSKQAFDSVPISVATDVESESSSVKCSLEVFRAVNKKFGSFDIVFLAQFAQENFSEGGRCR
jgi:hypothetical protein